MKIVIKVGTQSILSADGTPFEPVMQGLVEQIVSLKNAGHQVILVSSGAVASGRKVAREVLGREYGSLIGEKQLLAALGQPELVHRYTMMFKQYQMLAAQLLLTKNDFQTRQHYLNISRLLRELLEQPQIIPIINENDSVAIEELMFTDNDELAGLIAAQLNADKLIILSNVEGVFTGDPRDPSSSLISIIDPAKNWPEVSSEKSTHGRGGMISKMSTARKMSGLGITTHIASMAEPSVILRIINAEPLGTSILPARKKSSIKRWMACNTNKNRGAIVINPRLATIIRDNQRVLSILPVGIEKSQGDFKRGDLIDIVCREGNTIGIGIARYDSIRLSELLGQKDKPEFIHYDHLHLF